VASDRVPESTKHVVVLAVGNGHVDQHIEMRACR
jgi:hypothetical protein